MSLEEEQKEAQRYAASNCIYDPGSLMGGDLGNTSCEMGYDPDTRTDAHHTDGFHRIHGEDTDYEGIKLILSTDVSEDKNNFGSVIRIESLSGAEIDMNSEFGQTLLKEDQTQELYARSLAQLKFFSETSSTRAGLIAGEVNIDQWEAAQNAIERNDDGDLTDLWNKIDTNEYARNTDPLTFWMGYKDLDTKEYTDNNRGIPIDPGGNNETEIVKSNEEELENTVEELDTNNGLGDIFKLHPVLKYPADAAFGSGGQDYMRFETFKYQPPNQGAFNKKVRQNAPEPQILQTLKGESIPRNSNLGEYGNTIKLPIPNDLRVSNGVEWGGGKANAMEMASFQSATNKIGQIQDGGFGKMLDGIGNIGKLIDVVGKLDNNDQAGGTALTAMLAKVMLSAVNINVDTNQFVARSLGIAINPNLELLFSSPKLRNFTFRFDFAPNDDEDAKVSRHIMRVFKQGMQPTGYGGRREGDVIGSSNIFIGAPRVFRIGYFNGTSRIRGLPIHKICALTQVSTNFTPENVYQSYADSRAVSNPVRSTMELAFTELTPIFAEDYLGDGEGGTKQQKENFSIEDLQRAEGEGGILQGDNAINTEDIGF